jgi:hypothetical protein
MSGFEPRVLLFEEFREEILEKYSIKIHLTFLFLSFMCMRAAVTLDWWSQMWLNEKYSIKIHLTFLFLSFMCMRAAVTLDWWSQMWLNEGN